MPTPVILETPRLLLRPWRDEDRAPFAAQSGDPRVMAFFPRPLAPAESDELLARIRAHFDRHGYGWWAVEEKGGEPLLGYVGLEHCDYPVAFAPALTIGWRLGAEHWQAGFAHEAAEAALAFAFERLGVEEVVAFTVPANLQSLALMERLGMSYDARDDFQHPHMPPGHRLRHHLLYRLSRAAWRDRPATN
jgi:RimJ/RimL family protein N-acetyltransferase